MARLINDVNDIKRHIVVAAQFDFLKVMPFAKRVERKLILELIGQEQYDALVVHNFEEDSNDPLDLVKGLLESAVVNLSLFRALPTINVLITNSGSKTSENKEASNADWKDKRDLSRSLLSTYNEDLDSAFQIMEENIDVFPDWHSSKYYTIFKELVVQHTAQFNDHFTIKNNRQTFIALKPYMREVEDQYLKAMLGPETLALLKTKSAITIVNNAQEIARKAVVAFTVAKAAITGTFDFTDSSFTVASEQMPWDKQQLLEQEDRNDLKNDRQSAGEEYLKSLKKLIVAYPLMFPDYEDKIEKGIADKIIKRKSGLYL
jgi:hypothetical protein